MRSLPLRSLPLRALAWRPAGRSLPHQPPSLRPSPVRAQPRRALAPRLLPVGPRRTTCPPCELGSLLSGQRCRLRTVDSLASARIAPPSAA
eukprot:11170728-Lingulodinium_polyedra.AAC.1